MPLKHQPETQGQQGQILLTLLIIISIGIVIALSLIQVTLTQQETVRYEDFSLHAYYAAEAGIEEAIPRLREASNLNGSALNAYLENPANEITLTAPVVIDNAAGSSYDRVVQRSESQPLIERTVEADQLSQFDLSDLDDVNLEDAQVTLSWEDATCDASGVCDAVIELIYVSQLAATTNLLYNPSFEAPVVGGTQSVVASNWSAVNSMGTYGLTNDPAAKYDSQYQSIRVDSGEYAAFPGAGTGNPLDERAGLTRNNGSLIPLNTSAPGTALGVETVFTLSAYVRTADLSGTFEAQPYLLADDVTTPVAHREFDSHVLKAPTGNLWQRVHISFTADANAAWLRPYLVFGNGATGTVWIDGVQFEQKDYATAYCDGNQVFGSGQCVWDSPGAEPFSTSSRNALYAMDRYLYDPRASGVRVPSGYDPLTDWDNGSGKITQSFTIDYPSSNRILRVRSLYGRVQTELTATPSAGTGEVLLLPGQTIEITATGGFENVRKAITLERGLPTLLPQFDFALYNHGCADGGGCVPRDLVK